MKNLKLESNKLESDCQVKTSLKDSNNNNEATSKKVNCKRCNRQLFSEESKKRGYGKKCYRIVQLQKVNVEQPVSRDLMEEMLNRVKKLELDNAYLKSRVKNLSTTKKTSEWDDWKQERERPEQENNEIQISFKAVISELKLKFNGETFNIHDILSPIEANEEIILPPIIEVLI